MRVIGTGILFDFFRDDASHTAATQNASGGITVQSTLSGEAGKGQSGALEPTPKGNDALDDATRGITRQSTLPGKANAGALPAAKSRFEPDVEGSVANLIRQAASKASGKASGKPPSTPAHAYQPASPPWTDASGAPRRSQTHAEPAADTLPSDAPQNAPKGITAGITAQSTQPDKAASQPDDAARLQAQIEGCLIMETDPALRLFLEQLRQDSYHYPAETVRQQLEAYLQASNPDDFLNRLAALHLSWALDDVAADPDGNRLVRGDTGERKAILERIEAAFRAETEPVARCYLAKLARKAVSNPPGAGEGLEGYIDARTSPTWLWLAAVFVAGSPEAAFQWRLQEARRKTADARLLGYLDKLEQEARVNLPEAVSKLEAFTELMAIQGAPAA